MFFIGFALGMVAASIPWWIKVRGLNGVVSDLQNAKAAAQKAAQSVPKV